MNVPFSFPSENLRFHCQILFGGGIHLTGFSFSPVSTQGISEASPILSCKIQALKEETLQTKSMFFQNDSASINHIILLKVRSSGNHPNTKSWNEP